MWRVLRPDGYILISVPNLASFHNRILLALGRQPTSIRTFGPHVRGFSIPDLKKLVSLGGRFEIRQLIGVGFYPLPTRLAKPLARLWKGACHTPLLVAQKVQDANGALWLKWLHGELEGGLQTFYS
jgi:hypothetical protein